MPFVIADPKHPDSLDHFSFRIDAGERVTMIDARGRRAEFEIVEMVGTAGEVACLFVNREECTAVDDGLYEPDVPEIPKSEFLPGGDYLLLRPVPGSGGAVCFIGDGKTRLVPPARRRNPKRKKPAPKSRRR